MARTKPRALPALGLLAAGLAATAQTAYAASNAADGVVHLDIQRRSTVDKRPLGRRADTIVEAIENDRHQGAYMADVKVGTPLQTLTLQLDTGSSDTWVVYTGSEICTRGECDDGSFDPNESSTFTDLAEGAFSIAYVDETSAKGDYFNDVFQIGGGKLRNLTMGIGIDTDIPFGLVGVGYPSNEAGVEAGTIQPYPNLPLQMVNEGLTRTPAYSIWLNDLESASGSLLFGGIDTAKYRGPLTRLRLYPTKGDSTTINEFAVALTSVTAVSSSGTDKLASDIFPAAVVLDSGSTSSYLPPDLAQQIWAEAGVTLSSSGSSSSSSSSDDIPVVPCSYITSTAHFAFGFGGPNGAVIQVAMSELVLGQIGTFSAGEHNGQDACVFGIRAASSGSTLILGDSFLRSAFVVYDLANDEVALAQTVFNVTTSNIVPFASLSATVPSSTPAPSQAKIAEGVVTETPAHFTASRGFTSAAAEGLLGRGVGAVVLAVGMSVGVGLATFFGL